MTAVTTTRAMVSETSGSIGISRCIALLRAIAKVAPPKAADKNPARVTPIWTADKNRFGFSLSRATIWPRRPRRASCLTWLSRSDTNAISAAANTPPTKMKTKITATLSTVLFTGCSVRSGIHQAKPQPPHEKGMSRRESDRPPIERKIVVDERVRREGADSSVKARAILHISNLRNRGGHGVATAQPRPLPALTP